MRCSYILEKEYKSSNDGTIYWGSVTKESQVDPFDKKGIKLKDNELNQALKELEGQTLRVSKVFEKEIKDARESHIILEITNWHLEGNYLVEDALPIAE
ncbi:hypothetical protein [Oceanobacillus aidingensis]|uniref:Uncharacterized protein n=1 Tax=Oceanobacillus aidingensis TaxID=645964 RepID=A0ABV9JVD2_9BACI